MRVTATILCQDLDEAGVVILDDVSGAEVVIPRDAIGPLITALVYFRRPADERPPADTPETVAAKMQAARRIADEYGRQS